MKDSIGKNKTILVAPLNWGLGHAVRSIVIVNELIDLQYRVIVASDSQALKLLKKELKGVIFLELPSYQITYSTSSKLFKTKLLFQLPYILKAIKEEYQLVKKWIKEYQITGIISDNRPGVYSKDVPSAYLTHQLTVKSGLTTLLTTWVHRRFIRRFDACWVPDFKGKHNLSGELSEVKNYGFFFRNKINPVFIGPLSRMYVKNQVKKYDLLVVLSGPEPQRTLLEKHLLFELKKFRGTILFVAGIIQEQQKKVKIGQIDYVNFLTHRELLDCFNQSELIISRSGYTTIMDLISLEKKAFFIPTPGQKEQEYLARRCEKLKLAPFCKQHKFSLDQLSRVDKYRGFVLKDKIPYHKNQWNKLFNFFDSKREF